MPVMKMQFVNIVGPLNLFEKFVLSHIINHDFEIENSLNVMENVKGLTPFGEFNRYSALMARMDSLNKIFEIIPEKIDVEKLAEEMDEIFEGAELFTSTLEEKINENRKEIDEYKAEMEKSRNILNRMMPLIDFDVDLSDLDMNFINVRFGRMAYENYRRLNDSIKKLNVIVFFLKRDGDDVWFSYYAPNAVIEEVDNIFASLYFEKIDISDSISGTPAETANVLNEKIKEMEDKIKDGNERYNDLIESSRSQFAEFYSYINYLHKTADIKRYAAHTEESFYLSGWIPAGSMNALEVQYRSQGISFYFEDPEQMETLQSPTALKNPAIVRPFEFIVKTYGTPSHDEMDPTLFVAITYVLMFGLMFGDVGHGFVLAALGLAVYLWKKIDLAGILSMCGISSIIFGFVYGSIFGNEELLKPLYRNPMRNIMTMLIASVCFGVVVILVAMIINIANAIKARRFKEILFDRNGIAGLVFYLGAIIFAVVLAVSGKAVSSFFFTMGFFIIPIILMFLKEPLHNLMTGKKFLPAKEKGTFFVEAFFELFETVLSFLSNTLSFVRIGAFALSHAGLSLAVWSVYRLIEGTAGQVIALVIGNILIIVLEGLVVGIQGLRLEYYELFSRFFKGNGREFKPTRIGKENK